MRIVRYTSDRAQEWDAFVKMSKNGTFLFLRAYMDYHSDRFQDHSLMYYSDKGKLLAVMPANEAVLVLCNTLHNTEKGNSKDQEGCKGQEGSKDKEGSKGQEHNKEKTLYSHQGLTYGGFILSSKAHIAEVGEMFNATIAYLQEHSISTWYYKQMPSVYHRLPAEEDNYWLWRHGAEMVECNMMTAIDLESDANIVSPRKRTYCSKLEKEGYTIEKDSPLADFWPILESNLMERFHSAPVHSLSEINRLKELLPQNIVCCTVKTPDDEVLAGTLLFITEQVVRTQYISASPEGKKCNALDFLMLQLVNEYKDSVRYFEFGTSMADDGINLNTGLILQKEGFGGRSIACKMYRIRL